ncbi:hypothetical protein GVAV_003343 [Gurleya vavrai]
MLILFLSLFRADSEEGESEYDFVNNQNAVISASNKDYHLIFDNNSKIFSMRENKNAILETESVKFMKNKDVYKIILGGQFMCFTKDGKKLKICDSQDAKGSNWYVKKEKGGYMIKNDKKTGFLFWKKDYCLVDNDKKLEMAECNKKEKSQKFKIKEFYEALGKDADKKEDSEEKESSSSSNDSKCDSNEKDEENEDDSNNEKNLNNKNKFDIDKHNDTKKKTDTDEALEMLNGKIVQNMHKGDLIRMTNNARHEFGTHGYNMNEKKSFTSENSKQTESKENHGSDEINVDNFESMLEHNLENKANAFASTNIKKIDNEDHWIAESFSPIHPEMKKFDMEEIEANPNLEKYFGVTNDPKSSKFNPIKFGAVNLMMGIDTYLNTKFGGDSPKIICKDEICDEDDTEKSKMFNVFLDTDKILSKPLNEANKSEK